MIKPDWVNTRWREVYWMAQQDTALLGNWRFVSCAEDFARDYWQDENIDWTKDLTVEDEENTYFAYLSEILTYEDLEGEEITEENRKFFKSLGV